MTEQDVLDAMTPLAKIIAGLAARIEVLEATQGGTTPAPTPEPTPEPDPEPTPVPSSPAATVGTQVTITKVDGKTITTDGSYKIAVGTMVVYQNGRTTPVMATSDGITLATREPGSDTDQKLAALVGTKLTVKALPDTVDGSGGSTPTTPTTPEPTQGTFQRRQRGRMCMNVGLGAGNDPAIPGIEGTSYTMAKNTELARMKSYGVNIARVGYLEGRIFPSAAAPATYWQGNDVTKPDWGRVMTLDHLLRIGQYASDNGLELMLDNHSYGYFPSNGASNRALLGSSGNTVDMWVERCYKLLTLLKADAKAWKSIKRFDVINEPYMAEHNAAFLAAAYQKLLDRCAPLTGTDLVYVFEGPAYSSMSRWAELVGDAFDNLKHPNGKAYIEFSAHGYPDRGRDGYFDENKDGLINAMDELLASGDSWDTLPTKLAGGFINWGKAKGYNLNVGETIVPGNLSEHLLPAWSTLVRLLLDNGVDVFVFGMADGMDFKSEHNIETTFEKSGGALDNTNTLNVVKALAKEYNV